MPRGLSTTGPRRACARRVPYQSVGTSLQKDAKERSGTQSGCLFRQRNLQEGGTSAPKRPRLPPHFDVDDKENSRCSRASMLRVLLTLAGNPKRPARDPIPGPRWIFVVPPTAVPASGPPPARFPPRRFRPIWKTSSRRESHGPNSRTGGNLIYYPSRQ